VKETNMNEKVWSCLQDAQNMTSFTTEKEEMELNSFFTAQW